MGKFKLSISYFLFFKIYFFVLHEYFASMYGCHGYVQWVQKSEEGIGSQEIELWITMNHYVGAGDGT